MKIVSRRSPNSKLARREALSFYFFISPWLIGFLAFILYPMISAVFYSFTNYDGTQMEFIGLSNYSELLNDSRFYLSLAVTLKYVIISVPLTTLAALSIAILLNQRVPFLSFWRTVYYLPSVLSGVAVALLWKWVLNPEFGLVNYGLFSLFGIEGPRWFYSEEWVIPSYWIMSLWGIGGTMVIHLASLQSVPTVLYEAAEIDGASSLQRFRYITLPLISPIISFTMITNMIFALRTFTQVFVISDRGRGGPNNASLFYVLYLFQNGFRWGRMGYASALALILFVVTMIFTLLMLRAMRNVIYYRYTDER